VPVASNNGDEFTGFNNAGLFLNAVSLSIRSTSFRYECIIGSNRNKPLIAMTALKEGIFFSTINIDARCAPALCPIMNSCEGSPLKRLILSYSQRIALWHEETIVSIETAGASG